MLGVCDLGLPLFSLSYSGLCIFYDSDGGALDSRAGRDAAEKLGIGRAGEAASNTAKKKTPRTIKLRKISDENKLGALDSRLR